METSVRQLSITADQIDCKITDARVRIRRELDRFASPGVDTEDAIGNIAHALRDMQAWDQVAAAYAKHVA